MCGRLTGAGATQTTSSPTLKPVIDGLVDAKVIPDDTPDHVSWDPPAISAPGTVGHFWRYTIRVRDLGQLDGELG